MLRVPRYSHAHVSTLTNKSHHSYGNLNLVTKSSGAGGGGISGVSGGQGSTNTAGDPLSLIFLVQVNPLQTEVRTHTLKNAYLFI